MAQKLLLASGNVASHVNANEAFLDYTMGLDKSKMGVHGQVLDHDNVRVELQRRQAKAIGLRCSVIDQSSA